MYRVTKQVVPLRCVDIKVKVVFVYMDLILKRNLCVQPEQPEWSQGDPLAREHGLG